MSESQDPYPISPALVPPGYNALAIEFPSDGHFMERINVRLGEGWELVQVQFRVRVGKTQSTNFALMRKNLLAGEQA